MALSACASSDDITTGGSGGVPSSVAASFTPETVVAVSTSARPVGTALEVLFSNNLCGDLQTIWNASDPMRRTADAENGFIETCTLMGTVAASFIPIERTVYDDPVQAACISAPAGTYYQHSGGYAGLRSSVCDKYRPGASP